MPAAAKAANAFTPAKAPIGKRAVARKATRPARKKQASSKVAPRRGKAPGSKLAAPAAPSVSPEIAKASAPAASLPAAASAPTSPMPASPSSPSAAGESALFATTPPFQAPSSAVVDPPPAAPPDASPTTGERAAFALSERSEAASDAAFAEATMAEGARAPVEGVDLDRWVLQDVLSHGPGQSVPLEQRLPDREGAPYTKESDPWQRRLAAKRAALALAGAPQQRRDVQQAADAFDIPLKNHPLVDLYIDYFTGRGRWFFARWLERASTLVPLMQEILDERGLPRDLVYLAMVESGFSPHAVSVAAASGYWQFIPSTGALFGLKQDRFVDERRDFVRATEAAGRFLHSLHGHFDGDWHLAWASYNAGEARIRRAMAKTGARTFWELIERPHGLAKETVHYVPKIIAAAIVAKDAARYGFVVPPASRLAYDQVTVDGALDVRVLAKRMHAPVESLRALNPALLYDLTPPDRRTRLRVPKGTLAQSEAALAALPRTQRLEYVAYRVQRGDTLSGIARRMHASIDSLRQFNRLKGTRLKLGQELVVPSALVGLAALQKVPRALTSKPAANKSVPARQTVVASAASALAQARPAAGLGRFPKARHVVTSGDTLWSIARRYGVALDTLGRRGAKATRLAVGDIVDIF